MKYCQKTTIKQAAELLKKVKTAALFAHTRPDGDTVGACVALKRILSEIGVKAEIFCDTAMSEKFLRFAETSEISTRFFGDYELYVAVDCGDVFRVGEYSGNYDAFINTLTVDHHCGESYSKYNCLCQYSSTCQIVYELAKELNVALDAVTATYLYMGLCTDTGNFSHSNTDEASFLMAAELLKSGAEIEKVNRIFFKEISISYAKLLSRVLSRIRSYYDGKLVMAYVMKKDLEEYGLDDNSTEGIVQYAINIDTAVVGISVCQYSENAYKISMRGKNFNVRDICKEFGGGGHIFASGCMISGFFEDVAEKLVRAVGRYL